jgi:hypothetical protein
MKVLLQSFFTPLFLLSLSLSCVISLVPQEMAVIKDTQREFQEILETSLNPPGKDKDEDFEEDEETFSDEEEGDDVYLPVDTPFVDASLSALDLSFRVIKEIMRAVTEIAEKEKEDDENRTEESFIDTWVATIYFTILPLRQVVGELGEDLYPPINTRTLASKYEALINRLRLIQQAIFAGCLDSHLWLNNYAAELSAVSGLFEDMLEAAAAFPLSPALPDEGEGEEKRKDESA